MDAHANLAVSTVAVAPIPASSGLSLTVATGQGVRFPAPPFNATVTAAGLQPDPSNSEIIRVTGVAGDVFTITRQAEPGGTARSIVATDRIAETITSKTLTDLEAAVAAGASSVAAETSRATTAEGTLTTTLASEASARASADSGLSGSIATAQATAIGTAAGLAYFFGGS